MKVPEMFGRDYMYGVDRRRFDALLWDHLARFPAVSRRDGISVTGMLRGADDTVVGVVAREHGGPEEQIRARCVVGADGRFSLVARQVGAPVVEEDSQHVSTVYYADWENVAPFRPGVHGGHIHATGRGLDVLFFPMPDGRFSINTHERADRVRIEGDAEGYYHGVLRRLPGVWRRLEGAHRVSEVIGIKRIGNAYREASGAGWVLVGDALHYKDPVDGQGIYDALISARYLDAELGPWLAGQQPWETAMTAYVAGVRARPMPCSGRPAIGYAARSTRSRRRSLPGPSSAGR
jgi:2-polyprenyl-6-methoxyphenol hydroxylase-like FAD-dependent oxidoreductase